LNRHVRNERSCRISQIKQRSVATKRPLPESTQYLCSPARPIFDRLNYLPIKNMSSTTSLLKLMYLVSPALPIGAYAYSQGQELAVDEAWLSSTDDIIDWIHGVMEHSIATNDAAVLAIHYDAWLNNDRETLDEWNTFLMAGRETKELLLEDEQLATGLLRVLQTHNIDIVPEHFSNKPSFPLLFALAGVKWQIPKNDLLEGFLWSWLENQVAAATKTVPLGQTQAQKILMAILPHIPELVEKALAMPEDHIGAGLPGLALASSLHERQYSRLFRS